MKTKKNDQTAIQKATAEYRELFFKKYGVRLTDIEATKQTTDFINLFRVLL